MTGLDKLWSRRQNLLLQHLFKLTRIRAALGSQILTPAAAHLNNEVKSLFVKCLKNN